MAVLLRSGELGQEKMEQRTNDGMTVALKDCAWKGREGKP